MLKVLDSFFAEHNWVNTSLKNVNRFTTRADEYFNKGEPSYLKQRKLSRFTFNSFLAMAILSNIKKTVCFIKAEENRNAKYLADRFLLQCSV